MKKWILNNPVFRDKSKVKGKQYARPFYLTKSQLIEAFKRAILGRKYDSFWPVPNFINGGVIPGPVFRMPEPAAEYVNEFGHTRRIWESDFLPRPVHYNCRCELPPVYFMDEITHLTSEQLQKLKAAYAESKDRIRKAHIMGLNAPPASNSPYTLHVETKLITDNPESKTYQSGDKAIVKLSLRKKS